jgi:hypothetical protein
LGRRVEDLQQLVADSEGARKLMDDLADQKAKKQEHHVEALSQLETLERLAGGRPAREKVREAQQEVDHIKGSQPTWKTSGVTRRGKTHRKRRWSPPPSAICPTMLPRALARTMSSNCGNSSDDNGTPTRGQAR